MAQILDLSSIGFIKRITMGQKDTKSIYTEEQAQQDIKFLNKCLNDFPKGRIVACEKNFNVLNIGEHQVVQQWIVYHIGFKTKPLWMENK
ncbi:hypothetical protein A7X81_08185 [Campylobacter ornithocola]|uniref:Uncharacterized protein n=1 Tax=Campylobacter ornithocola TaxID=1848766 RepID=A0A6M8MQZ3_9BACT|nr:hypothetical protein [Campylobacter ornithocola]OCX43211.1 hypothetical protein A7X81_08185 [Campylobacter ornithocola]QKF56882.1 hypothetical protein CORN_0319 [Campylobacter ornithocola]